MTTEPWERGSWMQTFTGKQFYPLAPRAEDIDPTDIAHALSLICRYGGHTTRFYSVAEHCVILSHVVAPEHALEALLHDATEAYVGDMVRPLKHHMPDYREVEQRVWSAITLRFNLREENARPRDLAAEVVDADNRILLDERAAVLAPTDHTWQQDDLLPLGVTIRAWDPPSAEWIYRDRLEELLEIGAGRA